MNIQLKKAAVTDSERLHKMQISAYAALLEKYRDIETNPGAESLERVRRRFANSGVDQYFICLGDEPVGYIRIQRLDGSVYRLSQMFISPEFRGNGYAQAAIKQAESLYPQAAGWELDTIKQEPELCHLYEKMGYKLTGNGKNIKEGMDLADFAK